MIFDRVAIGIGLIFGNSRIGILDKTGEFGNGDGCAPDNGGVDDFIGMGVCTTPCTFLMTGNTR